MKLYNGAGFSSFCTWLGMDPLLAFASGEISFILQLNQPLNGKENLYPVSVIKTGGQGGN